MTHTASAAASTHPLGLQGETPKSDAQDSSYQLEINTQSTPQVLLSPDYPERNKIHYHDTSLPPPTPPPTPAYLIHFSAGQIITAKQNSSDERTRKRKPHISSSRSRQRKWSGKQRGFLQPLDFSYANVTVVSNVQGKAAMDYKNSFNFFWILKGHISYRPRNSNKSLHDK